MKEPPLVKGRRVSKDGRVYITLRFDPELVDKIDAECERRLISRTRLLERAVEQWLRMEGS